MNKDTIRLTSLQKKVVKDLQGGAVLCTSSDAKGADVSFWSGAFYHINNGVFWRLVEKGFIFQNSRQRHNFTLTEKGKSIKL